MQGVAELVERQRLDVKLDVGTLLHCVGSGEDAELRGCHGQRAAATEGIVEAHQAAAEDVAKKKSTNEVAMAATPR